MMNSSRSHRTAYEAEEYPAMIESTTDIRIVPLPEGQDVLTDILRDGARKMLTQAVEAEVAAWIDAHAHLKDVDGRRANFPSGRSRRASAPSRSSSRGSGTVRLVDWPRNIGEIGRGL